MVKKVIKEKPKLTVEKRKIEGRKVKGLRNQGILPANIYGKGIKSLAVQTPQKEFMDIYHSVGETGIVEIKVQGEDKVRPILIHNVQLDHVTDVVLHADLHQVDLKEAITANIPVEIVGEAPAVSQKIGILIQQLSEIEVEALPDSLPDKFEVDVSSLKAVDDSILVENLKPQAGVKILTLPKEVLVKIEPPAKEEVAPPPAVEAIPSEEKPAEEVAGAKPGEVKPAEGKPPEEKPGKEEKNPAQTKPEPPKAEKK